MITILYLVHCMITVIDRLIYSQYCLVRYLVTSNKCIVIKRSSLIMSTSRLRLQKSTYNYLHFFIAIALDETLILVAVHFSTKNIVTSCDHDDAKDGANVNAIQ